MWYKIDMNKLAVLILPPILRRKVIYALLKVIVTPFSYLITLLNAYRQDAATQQSVNGQVIYIEKALNDYFLLPEKEIYVTEINIDNIAPDVFLYDGDEGDFDTFFFDGDTANETYLPDGDVNASLAYYVNVPSYLKIYEVEIKNLVEFYKPAGRKYIIVYYDL